MSNQAPTTTRTAAALDPGTPVEVHSRFDRTWRPGFRVEAVEGRGYRLRRISDGAVLPAVFAFTAVREECSVDVW
ncbi:MAG TPA: hypothetical protein VFV35_05785 [Acidimicrobiales bacterium]|nr:hypothetical protein [Acidimicrobiales bacterium]